MTDGWGISCKIALRWMPLDLTDDKSTLIQVMAWCLQATSHYLSQCWPRSLSPYGVTRPQWVNDHLNDMSHYIWLWSWGKCHGGMHSLINIDHCENHPMSENTACHNKQCITSQCCSFQHNDHVAGIILGSANGRRCNTVYMVRPPTNTFHWLQCNTVYMVMPPTNTFFHWLSP